MGEAARIQKEKEGESLALLIQEKNKAIRVTAEADASRISQIGDAEAGAVRAKGEAEADVLRKKAEAYKEYGEAAIVQSIVDQLPAIADSISQPLANTDKMVFISNDGSSGSKLTKDIVNIMSEIPDAVDALTGVDLKNVLKRIADKPGQ